MNLKSIRTPAIVTGSLLPVLAMANEPTTAAAAFNGALTQATSAVGTYAAALVGLAAVGVVFMIAIKYVKKIRGAA